MLISVDNLKCNVKTVSTLITFFGGFELKFVHVALLSINYEASQ